LSFERQPEDELTIHRHDGVEVETDMVVDRGHVAPSALQWMALLQAPAAGGIEDQVYRRLSLIHVEGAREMLKSQQQLKLGHIVHRGKKHPTKWLTYLRTLDAKENRVSLTKIATGVLGWTKEHTRTDPAQWARDTVKQAEALCFNWPD
jgi:hypothetical protein